MYTFFFVFFVFSLYKVLVCRGFKFIVTHVCHIGFRWRVQPPSPAGPVDGPSGGMLSNMSNRSARMKLTIMHPHSCPIHFTAYNIYSDGNSPIVVDQLVVILRTFYETWATTWTTKAHVWNSPFAYSYMFPPPMASLHANQKLGWRGVN